MSFCGARFYFGLFNKEVFSGYAGLNSLAASVSSEIVALRFGWIDFDRLHLKLHRGRIPRMGGLEAEPKTGRREVDCSYAPEIFRALGRLKAERYRLRRRSSCSLIKAAGHLIRNGSTIRFGNRLCTRPQLQGEG